MLLKLSWYQAELVLNIMMLIAIPERLLKNLLKCSKRNNKEIKVTHQKISIKHKRRQ